MLLLLSPLNYVTMYIYVENIYFTLSNQQHCFQHCFFFLYSLWVQLRLFFFFCSEIGPRIFYLRFPVFFAVAIIALSFSIHFYFFFFLHWTTSLNPHFSENAPNSLCICFWWFTTLLQLEKCLQKKKGK